MAILMQSINPKLQSLRNNIHMKGVWKGTLNFLYEFIYKNKFRKIGVTFPDFSGNRAAVTEHALFHDAVENQESSFWLLKRAFSHMPLRYEDTNMLDIGCGSGRAMLMGMELGFLKVKGVDLDTESLRQAEINCLKMKARGSKTKFLLTEADAADYRIPAGTNLVYLFNPFGPDTLSRVADNIAVYAKETKFVCYVVYLNPKYPEVFMRDACFELHYSSSYRHGKYPEMKIYRVVPQLAG